MRFQFALLANGAAGPPDGLLYVLGGGMNTIWSPQVPTVFKGALVIRLLADRSEAGRFQQLEIQVNDADGNSILQQPIQIGITPQLPPQLPRGWAIPCQLVADLTGLQLPRAGEYAIAILLNGTHVGGEAFQVVEGLPPGALTTGPGPLPRT
jgi:hypothetical protein